MLTVHSVAAEQAVQAQPIRLQPRLGRPSIIHTRPGPQEAS